jgi:hypothetical protein
MLTNHFYPLSKPVSPFSQQIEFRHKDTKHFCKLTQSGDFISTYPQAALSLTDGYENYVPSGREDTHAGDCANPNRIRNPVRVTRDCDGSLKPVFSHQTKKHPHLPTRQASPMPSPLKRGGLSSEAQFSKIPAVISSFLILNS